METNLISPINLYIGMAISGVFTGIGVAVGTYIADKYLLTKTKKLIKALETKLGKDIISKKDESDIDASLE